MRSWHYCIAAALMLSSDASTGDAYSAGVCTTISAPGPRRGGRGRCPQAHRGYTILETDLDQESMQNAAIRFARAARTADVALFYYSGHALQHEGVNYLLPVDTDLRDEADLRRMTGVDEYSPICNAPRTCASWCSIRAATIHLRTRSSAPSG